MSDACLLQQRKRFIRISELTEMLGISRSTIFRMVRDGILPSKVRISQRAVGFRSEEIENFIESRTDVKVEA